MAKHLALKLEAIRDLTSSDLSRIGGGQLQATATPPRGAQPAADDVEARLRALNARARREGVAIPFEDLLPPGF